MKVSIITAVLNNRDYIEDCLKTILNQTYPNIEHTIIDGGCPFKWLYQLPFQEKKSYNE